MPRKETFQLANPYLEGSINTSFDATEPIDAAKQMWLTLAEHVVQHVPNTMFTMRNVKTNKYHNFDISENAETGKFMINELDLEVDNKKIEKFTENVDKYIANRDSNQTGGKKRYKKESSTSSSSSSTSIYSNNPTIIRTSPISFYHYTTGIYPTFPVRVGPSYLNPQLVAVQTPLFAPIFRPVLGTYVGIWP